jgi:hypothetical protein
VGRYVQACRPQAIKPTRALAGFATKPGFVVFKALLRAEGFECPAVPHQSKFPMAIGTVIFHELPLTHRSEIMKLCPI